MSLPVGVSSGCGGRDSVCNSRCGAVTREGSPCGVVAVTQCLCYARRRGWCVARRQQQCLRTICACRRVTALRAMLAFCGLCNLGLIDTASSSSPLRHLRPAAGLVGWTLPRQQRASSLAGELWGPWRGRNAPRADRVQRRGGFGFGDTVASGPIAVAIVPASVRVASDSLHTQPCLKYSLHSPHRARRPGKV